MRKWPLANSSFGRGAVFMRRMWVCSLFWTTSRRGCAGVRREPTTPVHSPKPRSRQRQAWTTRRICRSGRRRRRSHHTRSCRRGFVGSNQSRIPLFRTQHLHVQRNFPSRCGRLLCLPSQSYRPCHSGTTRNFRMLLCRIDLASYSTNGLFFQSIGLGILSRPRFARAIILLAVKFAFLQTQVACNLCQLENRFTFIHFRKANERHSISGYSQSDNWHTTPRSGRPDAAPQCCSP